MFHVPAHKQTAPAAKPGQARIEKFDFAIEFGNSSFERSVSAPSRKAARAAIWAGLTDSQRDNVSCIDCLSH